MSIMCGEAPMWLCFPAKLKSNWLIDSLIMCEDLARLLSLEGRDRDLPKVLYLYLSNKYLIFSLSLNTGLY